MFKRVLFGGLFLLSATTAISATVVAASGITERLESQRMTVLKTDLATGRFLCAEHRHWTPALKADLRGLNPGDIVRVEPREGGRAHLVLLRTAADELSSPEN